MFFCECNLQFSCSLGERDKKRDGGNNKSHVAEVRVERGEAREETREAREERGVMRKAGEEESEEWSSCGSSSDSMEMGATLKKSKSKFILGLSYHMIDLFYF